MIFDFDRYRERFNEYVNSLGNSDDFVQEHLDLKIEHTFRVVENIRQISVNSGFSQDRTSVARLIALFHDIGRFEQFIRYRTFDDKKSVNHAELGVQILMSNNFLDETGEEIQSLICRAIMNHNVAKLDPGLDDQTMLYAKLIRDADKVDIWYILTLRDVVNVILENHTPDESYDVPQYILESYRKGKPVPHAITMNDYRLLRLSWIYDMNYKATFAQILKRDYLSKILAKIPHSPEKEEIQEIIYRYVYEKAGMQYSASRQLSK